MVVVPATGPFPHRTYGVLLHPSSLPGPDLIGTVGAGAHRFVDWLASTGAAVWQILPLTINGRYDSPYDTTADTKRLSMRRSSGWRSAAER